MARAGFVFDVIPAVVDELRFDGEAPRDYVSRLASTKAEAVASGLADRQTHVVIGADTVVVVDGEVLEKPEDADDARRMLRCLSGRSHDVLTGVVVLRGSERRDAVEQTRVTVVDLDDETIEWYVASGEPTDKAGAYGVQGIASRFVARVEGSYTNVVGLPVALVDRLLRDICSGDTQAT